MLSTSVSLPMRILTVLSLGIPIILQLLILFLLFRRKLQRRFPWFLTYVVYELFEAAARLIASGSPQIYLKVYWFSAIGGIALTLVALWESFSGIFWLETKQRWFQYVCWGAVSVVLAYSALRAWLYTPREPTGIGALALNLEIAVEYLIAALGLLYFGLIRFFKVIGHQRESSII